MRTRYALLGATALASMTVSAQAAPTVLQWGVDRGTAPWTACAYDSNNVCQGVFTLPASGGGALVPPAHGGTGVNNGSYTITLGGNVSTGGSLSTTGAFATGGAFSTTGTFSSGGNFSTGSTFSTTGAFSTGGAFTTGSTFSTTGAFGVGGAFSTAGPFTISGPYAFTGTITADTSVTFPTSGTLATTTTPAASVIVGTTGITGGASGSILYDNAGALGEATQASLFRTLLSGPRSYYVNWDGAVSHPCGHNAALTCSPGSDAYSGLSNTTPFQTLQAALNAAFTSNDLNRNTLTIYLAETSAGPTYDNQKYHSACDLGPTIGLGVIKIEGSQNNKLLTQIQDPDSGYGLLIKDLCTLDVSGVDFVDSPSASAAGHIIVGGSGNAGHLDAHLVGLETLALAGATGMTAGLLGSITFTGPISVNGNMPYVVAATSPSSVIDASVQTMTIAGGLTWGSAFAYEQDGGQIRFTPSTVSGTATGPRCLIIGPTATIGNSPNNIFPGSTACVPKVESGNIAFQTGAAGSQTYDEGTSGYFAQSQGAGQNDLWTQLAMANISDYATGTWTPTLRGSGTAGTPTYTTQVGSYEKIGRQVTARFQVVTNTSLGGVAGNMQIGGLPFASNGTASDWGSCTISDMVSVTLDASYVTLTGLITSSASVVSLFELGSGVAAQAAPVGKFGVSTALVGVCNYHT